MDFGGPGILGVITAAGALAAAAAAFQQARSARYANEAQIFLAFSARYNDEAMANSLRLLVDWHRRNPDDFAEKYAHDLRVKNQAAIELNAARRTVSRYYTDLGRLFFGGLVTRRLARTVSANNGINVFFVICEPMNEAQHPQRDKTFAKALKKARRRYGKGEVF